MNILFKNVEVGKNKLIEVIVKEEIYVVIYFWILLIFYMNVIDFDFSN